MKPWPLYVNLAYVVMAYKVIANVVMAYVGMACVVMAYIVMARIRTADGTPAIYDPASYYGHYEADHGINRMFGGGEAFANAG